MKKFKVILVTLFITLMFIIPANAMEINSASNKFIFDNSALSSSNVLGDLLAFGNDVFIKGNVGGDIICGGQTVGIQVGDTTSNIYAAGSRVSISSGKTRNIYAAGGSVVIEKGADINGAYLAGKDIFFSGNTKDLYVTGENIKIDGNVTGNLVIRSDNIDISSQSKIGGMVVIYASNQPQLPETINKENIKFNKIMPREQQRKDEITGMIIMKVLGLLTAVLIAGIFILLNSKYFLLKAKEFKEKLGRNILYGLIAFIVIPIASIIVMIPIITIPISIIVLILYGIMLFVAPVYTGVVIGRLFLQNANRYLAAMAGAAAVGIVLLIPFVGALGFLFCAFYTLGSIISNIKLNKNDTEDNNSNQIKQLNLYDNTDTI